MSSSDPKDLKRATLHHATISARADRRLRGKLMRSQVPLSGHASVNLSLQREDPVDLLARFNADRVQDLVPIRWGRMLKSPFTFFRGSAALMAADLMNTPRNETRVQACGDCHILNFGAFATPERNIVFDINDFDETLPAPWEWDVKRLATSFVLAVRDNGLDSAFEGSVATAVARAYREMTEKYSRMPILDIWYSRIDWHSVVAKTTDPTLAKRRKDKLQQAMERTVRDYYFPKLTEQKDGRFVIKENPPLVFHPPNHIFASNFARALPAYKESLQEDRRKLFERYYLEDVAIKVVGVGSVGTMCGVALFLAPDNEPLLLQIKEAKSSVLEQYIGKSEYNNHGQRVVAGQRIAQSASDIFLGWTQFEDGRHFYIRQLRDTKVKPEVEIWSGPHMAEAAELMGAVLARAHARSGDSAEIAGYLGDSDEFDKAIAAFAIAYADQTEQDHQLLQKAYRLGKVKATIEEEQD